MIPVGRRGEFDEGLEVCGSIDRVRVEASGGWNADWRGLPQGRNFGRDVLQLAQKLRRPHAVGDEAAPPARRRECQAEADCRRPVIGQGHAPGRAVKKALRPARKHKLVDTVKVDWKDLDPARMCGIEDRSVALCLQVQARRAGRTEAEDQGHLPDAGEARHEGKYRRIEVITGRRLRRNWTDEERTRILSYPLNP